MNKLAQLHNYQSAPETRASQTKTNTKVQGYSLRMGSALHAHRFVDYYFRTGKNRLGTLTLQPINPKFEKKW